MFEYHSNIPFIANADVNTVIKRDKEYGASWKLRGGVGAFMMIARKWDRIEKEAKERGWDIFKVLEEEHMDPKLTIDDIRDLRRYLLLLDAEMCQRGYGPLPEFNRDDINHIEKEFDDAAAPVDQTGV